jgi:hypothetical protein
MHTATNLPTTINLQQIAGTADTIFAFNVSAKYVVLAETLRFLIYSDHVPAFVPYCAYAS